MSAYLRTLEYSLEMMRVAEIASKRALDRLTENRKAMEVLKDKVDQGVDCPVCGGPMDEYSGMFEHVATCVKCGHTKI